MLALYRSGKTGRGTRGLPVSTASAHRPAGHRAGPEPAGARAGDPAPGNLSRRRCSARRAGALDPRRQSTTPTSSTALLGSPSSLPGTLRANWSSRDSSAPTHSLGEAASTPPRATQDTPRTRSERSSRGVHIGPARQRSRAARDRPRRRPPPRPGCPRICSTRACRPRSSSWCSSRRPATSPSSSHGKWRPTSADRWSFPSAATNTTGRPSRWAPGSPGRRVRRSSCSEWQATRRVAGVTPAGSSRAPRSPSSTRSASPQSRSSPSPARRQSSAPPTAPASSSSASRQRWRQDGLGPMRPALSRDARPPTLLVRKGLRPGGLAPPESLTRFTWSLGPAGV